LAGDRLVVVGVKVFVRPEGLRSAVVRVQDVLGHVAGGPVRVLHLEVDLERADRVLRLDVRRISWVMRGSPLGEKDSSSRVSDTGDRFTATWPPSNSWFGSAGGRQWLWRTVPRPVAGAFAAGLVVIAIFTCRTRRLRCSAA